MGITLAKGDVVMTQKCNGDKLPLDAEVPERLETATFAMG